MPEEQHLEDSRNGIPPVPGGGNAVGGGMREMDDGSGAFLPIEAAGSGTVHRLQEGYGAQVAGGPFADTSWEGSGWETELGNHGLWWGAT